MAYRHVDPDAIPVMPDRPSVQRAIGDAVERGSTSPQQAEDAVERGSTSPQQAEDAAGFDGLAVGTPKVPDVHRYEPEEGVA